MRMLGVAALALALAGCGGRAPTGDYRPTATIKDIMDAIIDPQADGVWDAVATVITDDGIEERAPKTDEEWTKVRRSAIAVIEATNLLVMPGRSVARPGEKSENPGIELHPEEIQVLIDQDRATFVKLAHGLHDATLVALKAIDAKDVAALSEAGGNMDMACENCHKTYWYPHQFDKKE